MKDVASVNEYGERGLARRLTVGLIFVSIVTLPRMMIRFVMGFGN